MTYLIIMSNIFALAKLTKMNIGDASSTVCFVFILKTSGSVRFLSLENACFEVTRGDKTMQIRYKWALHGVKNMCSLQSVIFCRICKLLFRRPFTPANSFFLASFFKVYKRFWI